MPCAELPDFQFSCWQLIDMMAQKLFERHIIQFFSSSYRNRHMFLYRHVLSPLQLNFPASRNRLESRVFFIYSIEFYCSLSARLKIFPTLVFGNSFRNSIARGTL